MNPTLVSALLRQRLASPVRLAILALQFLLPLGFIALAHAWSPLDGSGAWFAMTLAAGSIGQDVSSGTLQLLLARPVSRPSYVSSRWFASALAGSLCVLAQSALAALIIGHHAPATDAARAVLQNLLSAWSGAAVMVMFSSLIGALGDLALFFALYFTVGVLTIAASLEHWTSAEPLLAELGGTLEGKYPLAWITQGGPPPYHALAAFASTVTLALAIAVAAVNRKELSYAAE